MFVVPQAFATGSTTSLAEVRFNNAFLTGPDGTTLDVARFSKGNLLTPGRYRAETYVNDAWIGKLDVDLRAVDGNPDNVQPCMNRDLLERLGADLGRLSAEAAGRLDRAGECVTLPDLVPGATAAFDMGDQRLDVSLPQIAMTHAARGYVDPKYWDEGVNAARVQYNGNVYRWDSGPRASTQGYLGLDAVMNIGAWRLHHQGNFNHDESGSHYQNMQTYMARSIAPMRSQLLIGEANTDGSLFDSFGFRGVQLSSDERMYPESQRGYAPIVRGIANSNARVQIRQNGNTIYETTVPPGPFEISDLYPSGYNADLEVVVTEADGSVHISKIPYAAGVNALRAGSTRFSFTVGQYRHPTQRSTPLLAQATLQHGFTNLLTAYGGLIAAENYFSGMLGVALNTDYGALGLDVSQSGTHLRMQPDRYGQSVRLSYSKLMEPTNTSLTLAAYRYSTKGYLDISDAMALRDLDERGEASVMSGIVRGRLQLQVNQNLPQGFGNFYVTGSIQDYWNRGGRDAQLQAGYNNTYRRLSYGVSFGRQLNVGTNTWDNRIMLTLAIPLGTSAHAPRSMTSMQYATTRGERCCRKASRERRATTTRSPMASMPAATSAARRRHRLLRMRPTRRRTRA